MSASESLPSNFSRRWTPMALPKPSVSFITMLPTKPSQTATSTAPRGRSLASTFPTKFSPLLASSAVVSWTCLLPFPDSAPTLKSATLGLSIPQKVRAKTWPITAKLNNWAGRQSTLVPRSTMAVLGAKPSIGPPSAGRSTPSITPRTTAAAAMAAPVEPMVTDASARPFFTRPVETRIEAFGFFRSANAGESPSSTTPSDGTAMTGRPSVSCLASSARTTSGSPTSPIWTLPVLAAARAPATTSAGA